MTPPSLSRPSTPRLTLTTLFVVSIGGVTLLVGALFVVFLASSRRSMLRSAQLVRESAALRVEAEVREHLRQGAHTLENVERAIQSGVVDPSDPSSIESLLTTELLDADEAGGVTFVHATRLGFDASGAMETTPADRWLVTAFHPSTGPAGSLFVRHVTQEDGRFVADVRDRSAPPGSSISPRVPASDPTQAPPFRSATAAKAYGQTSYSDLGYAERDEGLPPAQRRVFQTVQRTIEDRSGRFVGVVSVWLPVQAVDAIAQLKVNAGDPSDPHRIFLCDAHGWLVTRLSKDDRFVEVGGVLRVPADAAPPPIAMALKSPLLREIGPDDRDRSDVLEIGGVPYLVTFHWLSRAQDWIVGIVVPEDYYVHDLRVLRDRFLTAYAAVSFVIFAGGFWAVRALRRGLRHLLDATAQMHRFDFSASAGTAVFAELQQTIDSLERAKTVVRAMGKYVPIDLVRELYATNREPALGGRLHELTIMFSDIRDFTGLSERLAPDDLARALGRYFETLTSAIAASGGTVDKYIGDSVMAFWNAPADRPGHPARACRAVLDCLAAAGKLYASEAWSGLPPLFTRFGVHSDTVLVGHFGAPARLNYTALGDGVNLASRLESLCKHYGVAVLVSEAVERAARDDFVFRRVDVVAVKGKTHAVGVYELLGAVGEDLTTLETARTYERAYDAYVRRDFAGALELFASCAGDGPAEVLAERCRRFLAEPPPADWDGSYHADTK